MSEARNHRRLPPPAIKIDREYRERNRTVTLEYHPSADITSRHVIKDVRLRYFPSNEKALKAFEELTQSTTAKKRAKMASTDIKVSIPPGEKKRGRPKKRTAEQAEAEHMTAYSMDELSELLSYCGPHDNKVEMLMGYVNTDKATAEALLAELSNRK